MKVALVLLWPLREFYSQDLHEMGNIEENWERIVSQKEDVGDRLAKALNDVDITSVRVHLLMHSITMRVHNLGIGLLKLAMRSLIIICGVRT